MNLSFSSLKRRKIEADFSGGDLTSDAGLLLLREVDLKLGLTAQLNQLMPDSRCTGRVQHKQINLLRQRLFALAAGYEDLNDHQSLRHDTALKTATSSLEQLASAPTLCRMEQRADEATGWVMHEVLMRQFIQSFDRAPTELILDFDATNDPVHGEQIGRYFNAFYDEYCFLPLFVFCGSHLLTAYLRSACRDAAYNAPAVLKCLVKRLRQQWPDVRIIVRADAGFCRPLLLSWCDRNQVDYVIGMTKNSVLKSKSYATRLLAKLDCDITGKKAVLFDEFNYSAGSWRQQERRMIVKAEHSSQGENPRYVVTSLTDTPEAIYKDWYCARGDMENRIKEQQFLFSDRTSCHHWWPNQFRLLLSGLAYTLVNGLRRMALHNTVLANAQVNTIRLKLFKVAAVVIQNTRRIKFMLPSHYPYQYEFEKVLNNLNSG
jgi:hypothetical protein